MIFKVLLVGVWFFTSLVATAKTIDTKPARAAASVMERAPIQSMIELCNELRGVRDLPARVQNFCTSEKAKAKAARELAKRDQDFKDKVKATIMASASKSDPQIPVAKLKWETLGCSENYDKTSFFCAVESTDTTPWNGSDSGNGPEFDVPNGVRLEVDKNGRLKSGGYPITYGCLQCAG